MSVYEKLHARWYNRAKERARQVPRYRELEDDIRTEAGTYLWTGKQEVWNEMEAIFDRTKRPLYLKVARFFEHKDLTPRHLRRRARFARQRVERGFSSGDVWSFDHYLNGVIIGGITELRHNLHGHPAGILDGDPFSGGTDDEMAYWGAVLTGIIEGFEAANDLLGFTLGPNDKDPDREAANAAFDLGFDLFHAYYFDLWD